MKNIGVSEMITNANAKFLKGIGIIAMFTVLVSCGGGGSGSGGMTEFSVIPDSWTLSFGTDNTACKVDSIDRPSVTVTVVGGAPPYRIVNSSSKNLSVSATTLQGKNPSFVVTALGGCGKELNILILDNLSRSVNFTTTLEAG